MAKIGTFFLILLSGASLGLFLGLGMNFILCFVAWDWMLVPEIIRLTLGLGALFGFIIGIATATE